MRNQYGEVSNNYVQGGQLYVNFIVDSANGNGLGIRSLKGAGVANVYMHTSATPASGNPNPAAGYILIQLSQGYLGYIQGFDGFVSPTTGSAGGSTTNHSPAIIASLGTTTLAQWQTAGLPVGVTPAVGVSFIATATGAIGGTGTVISPGVSGIVGIEVIGDPNLSSNPSTGGAWILCQCLGATNSSTTTLVPTAPADGTVIGLVFQMASVAQEG